MNPGISSTDAREKGCKEVIASNPDVTLVGVDYNDDDPSKAQAQVEAMLQKEPDLAGIFGTNVFSAQGAAQVVKNKGLSGKVKVVAFDATADAIEMLKDGTVDLVIAQKPADMGYFAVEMAMANMNGVTSVPTHIPTGYQVITRDNMNDPNVSEVLLHQVTDSVHTVGARSKCRAAAYLATAYLASWLVFDLPFSSKLCHDQS